MKKHLAMTLFAFFPCASPSGSNTDVEEQPERLGVLERAVIEHVLVHARFPRFAGELALAAVDASPTVIFQELGPERLLMITADSSLSALDGEEDSLGVRFVPIEVL